VKEIHALITKLTGKIRTSAVARSKMKTIGHLVQSGLPREMKPALKYLVSGNLDSRAAAVVKLAEERRNQIAGMGDRRVFIWGSPKPRGGAGRYPEIDARPQPGKVLEFTMERIARTGKNQKWGTVLYLVAREFKSSVVLELGTCAGISAMHLSQATNVDMFVTVEGSEELANIAKESLKACKNVEVINALFDDALDSQLLSLGTKVDLAFIDGHHEKTATIHYFNRLVPFMSPGAVVIFDDISWSYDMRDTWNILSKWSELAHAMDLGEIGVCVLKGERDSAEAEPKYWDLQPTLGKHLVAEGPDYWDWDR